MNCDVLGIIRLYKTRDKTLKTYSFCNIGTMTYLLAGLRQVKECKMIRLLTGCLCVFELSTSVSISSACTSPKQADFLCAAAQPCSHSETIVEASSRVSQTSGLPQIFDVLKWVTYKSL